MPVRRSTSPLLALALVLAAAAPVAAKDDGTGGDTATPTPPKVVCPEGEVWSELLEKCLVVKSEALDPSALATSGRDLALSGYYAEALPVLAAADQTDPVVLTYQGFAHRKLGRHDVAFEYYGRALAIDPQNRLALEYMGEGYAATGRKDLARGLLDRLEQACGGRECEEYRELAAAIADPSSAW